jgi:hypothetical protein
MPKSIQGCKLLAFTTDDLYLNKCISGKYLALVFGN